MINAQRLSRSIADLAAVGALPGGGVCRLALSDADGLGRDWLIAQMRDMGLDIAIDGIGNIFGTRAGSKTGRAAGPAVMIGSHIDTVATGGAYDGALGVLAGLEVMRALDDAGIATARPITVAAFTNEEGARFAPDMMGSLVFVGGMALAEAQETIGIDGVRLGDALARFAGTGAGPAQIAAYLELHIEQGPILEDAGLDIGVVEGVQGISWTEFTLMGRSAHAGTTPFRLRTDAGLVASKIAVAADRIARDIGGDQLATVGMMRFAPDLVNVVPEKATMTVDLRNPDEATLVQAEMRLFREAAEIADAAGIVLMRRSLARFAPVAFDPALIEAVADTAQRLDLPARRMFSGAGHDAQMIARIAPAAMIFVPSRAGISHNIHEHTAPHHLANGTRVLFEMVHALATRSA